MINLIPVTMTFHSDRSCGGHRDPYFLFTGEIILTPNGEGYKTDIKGVAYVPSGESTPLEMTGPLTSRGTWVTPYGWLGFQPIDLSLCPYPPIWGWHKCPKKLNVPEYLLEADIWALPTQERLDKCEVLGKIG